MKTPLLHVFNTPLFTHRRVCTVRRTTHFSVSFSCAGFAIKVTNRTSPHQLIALRTSTLYSFLRKLEHEAIILSLTAALLCSPLTKSQVPYPHLPTKPLHHSLSTPYHTMPCHIQHPTNALKSQAVTYARTPCIPFLRTEYRARIVHIPTSTTPHTSLPRRRRSRNTARRGEDNFIPYTCSPF